MAQKYQICYCDFLRKMTASEDWRLQKTEHYKFEGRKKCEGRPNIEYAKYHGYTEYIGNFDWRQMYRGSMRRNSVVQTVITIFRNNHTIHSEAFPKYLCRREDLCVPLYVTVENGLGLLRETRASGTGAQYWNFVRYLREKRVLDFHVRVFHNWTFRDNEERRWPVSTAEGQLRGVALALGIVTAVVESGVIAIAAIFIFGWSVPISLICGVVLAAISPAVTVPVMLDLQNQGLGTRKGVPTLALASATLDNVFCITAFSVIMTIVFSSEVSNRLQIVYEEKAFGLLWDLFFMPLLFALIGMKLDFSTMTWPTVLIGCALIGIGAVFRFLSGIIFSCCSEFNMKERLVLALSLLPKATVQAALAPAITVYAAGMMEYEKEAHMAQTACIITILLTAPLGQYILSKTAPVLLQNTRVVGVLSTKWLVEASLEPAVAFGITLEIKCLQCERSLDER
ncbi:hypothetical protein TELCIR_03364 [Teladorsagia circumcincta]|uniref:Cation/H+ exchanger transmembrane domain-containing protein n=1 Tax=Teladorsagia circumcincta TaxID=45464 RepID=A0A2G9UWM0_TELCI|nr:hypothetical protein TELCIR_03364 [Teladorsagia circumcincta]